MTVQKLFTEEKIGVAFIEETFEGGYWTNCAKFISENWAAEITSLSQKQVTWMHKIMDDCVEKRIEG